MCTFPTVSLRFEETNKRKVQEKRGSFVLFVPEEESCSLIPQPWPLAVSPCHRPDTHKYTLMHTYTHLHTMCRPDQSLTASPDPHYSLKYVSGPPYLISFHFFFFLPFLLIFRFFPSSHTLYPLSPNLYFIISPFSPSFSVVSFFLSL